MKSDEQRAGLLLDVEDERKSFEQELSLDERIEAIDVIVTHILKVTMETATNHSQLALAQVIVCNTKHKEAATWVSAKYKLNLVTSDLVPQNEVFVTSMDSIEELIKSRCKK